MDEEVENFVDKNNTDNLEDFDADFTSWDIGHDVIEIILSLTGLIANIIIIAMIWRNKRMRTRTNLLLMNYAINNGLFLISNVHFLTAILRLVEANEVTYFLDCIVDYMDIGFQFNELIFILILMSTTLIKSKKLPIKWVLVAVYTLVLVNFLVSFVWCYCKWWPVPYLMCFGLFLCDASILLFKEMNNCYRSWYRNDPLSGLTKFRLNLARIYIISWTVTIGCYLVANEDTYMFFFTVAAQACLISVYMLVYIVCADKNFYICLLNLLKCKGADAYDVDATITFAEEENENDAENPSNNRVNISFPVGSGHENPLHLHVQSVSTVQNKNSTN